MPTPTTTVVIPTFNGQPFLSRALQSLLLQTDQDFDVVVVSDDGFNYLPMAEAVLGGRVRHAFAPAPQSGPATARVTGINQTDSKVVGFLDVDDEYSPRRLEKLVPLALKHGASTSNLSRIDDATRMFINDSCPAGMPPTGLLREKHIPWLDGPLSPLVRRDCLPEYPDLWLFEDLFFLLRVTAKIGGALPVVRDEDAGYRYLIQPRSLSYGTDRDELTTLLYARILQEARNGGPLFEGASQDARDAFFECFSLKAIRSAAYDEAKREEADLDFQKFSPRFDSKMRLLLSSVPEHLRAWSD
jgi:glycosyltransferase involved in cell wall biosynthesis